MEFNAELIEKAISELHSSGSLRHKEANVWLMKAQSSKEAWIFISPLLRSDKNVQVQHFAMCTLYHKIKNDWSQITSDNFPGLESLILSFFSELPSRHRIIQNKFIQVVAVFALQSCYTFEEKSVENVLKYTQNLEDQRLGRILSLNIMISLLQETRSVNVSKAARGTIFQHVFACVHQVAWCCFLALGVVPKTNEANVLEIQSVPQGSLDGEDVVLSAKCVSIWVQQSHAFNYFHQVIMQLFHTCRQLQTLLKSGQDHEDVRSRVLEYITEIVTCPESITVPGVSALYLAQTISFVPFFEHAISQENVLLIEEFVKMYSGIGERHAPLIVQLVVEGTPEAKATASAFLDTLLACCSIPGVYGIDEDVSDYAYSSFYSIQDAIVDLSPEQLNPNKAFFTMKFLGLVTVLAKKSEFPDNVGTWKTDALEEWDRFRTNISDTVMNSYQFLREDLVHFLIAQLEQLHAAPQGSFRWQSLEALLFMLYSIADTLSFNSLDAVKKIMALLQRMKFTEKKCVSTAITMIGSFSEVISNDCAMFNSAVQLVLQGISDPELLDASTYSLKELLHVNIHMLAPIAVNVYQTCFTVLNSLSSRDGSNDVMRLISVLGYCIAVMDESEGVLRLKQILDPSFTLITSLLKNRMPVLAASKSAFETSEVVAFSRNIDIIMWLIDGITVDLNFDFDESDAEETESDDEGVGPSGDASGRSKTTNQNREAKPDSDEELRQQKYFTSIMSQALNLLLELQTFPDAAAPIASLFSNGEGTFSITTLLQIAIRRKVEYYSDHLPPTISLVMRGATFQPIAHTSSLWFDCLRQILIVFSRDTRHAGLLSDALIKVSSHFLDEISSFTRVSAAIKNGSVVFNPRDPNFITLRENPDCVGSIFSCLEHAVGKCDAFQVLVQPSQPMLDALLRGCVTVIQEFTENCPITCALAFHNAVQRKSGDVESCSFRGELVNCLAGNAVALVQLFLSQIASDAARMRVEDFCVALFFFNKHNYPILVGVLDSLMLVDLWNSIEQQAFFKLLRKPRASRAKIIELGNCFANRCRGLIDADYGLAV